MGAEVYKRTLLQLMPPGRAFPREDGTTLSKLALGLADELCRVDERSADLIAEFPLSTSELLSDWERALGLPDDCVPAGADEDERRASVVARLNESADNTPQGFIDIMATLGYAASVDEFDPFHVGLGAVGDGVAGDQWQFVWRLNIGTEVEADYFRAGVSRAGDRVCDFGLESVECLVNKLKPAHTLALFAYKFGEFLLESGGNLLTEDGELLIFEENVT